MKTNKIFQKKINLFCFIFSIILIILGFFLTEYESRYFLRNGNILNIIFKWSTLIGFINIPLIFMTKVKVWFFLGNILNLVFVLFPFLIGLWFMMSMFFGGDIFNL